MMIRPNRREFLQATAASTLGALLPLTLLPKRSVAATRKQKLPVAGIVTEYRMNSHGDVILGKILEGYLQDGGAGPDLQLVSLYTDQVPEGDMSHALASKHGFRLATSIDDAITLGTNQVQVAGVLSIGEHGNYPMTPDTKQHMYPRRRFFDEIVASFRRCDKSVPVFNDKHLGYRWQDARFMVDTAREMKFPLLAGSSLPVAWRLPQLELPIGCEIEDAVAIGYGGLEAYGFHALETLQCMIERRKGGESGVTSVEAISKSAIHQSQQQGRWSKELFDAAWKTMPGSPQQTDAWMDNETSAVFSIQHRDSLKSSVVMANGLASEFAVAVRLKGQREPIATCFKLQSHAPYGHFGYLVQAIEQTIHNGKSAYPVERTLLTTGVLDRIMQSLSQGGKQIETPELNVTYHAANWPFANHPNSAMKLSYE